ncbi:MAG: hypothetical protein EOO65_02920, partial [Methanosarcinales archaeon]
MRDTLAFSVQQPTPSPPASPPAWSTSNLGRSMLVPPTDRTIGDLHSVPAVQEVGMPVNAASGTDCRARNMAESVRRVASTLACDVHMYSTLDYQAGWLKLGPLLKSPLPVGTLDSASGGPTLVSALFPYIGRCDAFNKAVRDSLTLHEQTQYVVAVTQASGSGKTRLAYAEGAETSLTVLIRVAVNSDDGEAHNFSKPWAHLHGLVMQWCDVRSFLSATDKLTVARSALSAMRLLVTCYVEWLTAVLSEYVTLRGLQRPAHVTDDGARELRLVALRASRNGCCDDAVTALFRARLEEVSKPVKVAVPQGGISVIRLLDKDVVDAHTHEVNVRLRSLLWNLPQVMVMFDEAQHLMEKGLVFMRLHEYEVGRAQEACDRLIAVKLAAAPDADHTALDSGNNRTAAADLTSANMTASERSCKPVRPDLLYGLTALMASLSKQVKWVQVICGPWLRLTNEVCLPEFSNTHDRMIVHHHASRVEVGDMETNLRVFFDLGCEPLPADLRTNLALLVGRPRWFFDSFWKALWGRLE